MHAAGAADDEADQLRRRQLGGEDEVALVLPVRVVDHDHRAAGGDVGDGPVDAAELPGAQLDVTGWTSTQRSTYFAITSTSRLTGSPTAVRPSVVRARVVGISATVNSRPSASTTVRLIPSTVIEPFSTR